MDEIRNYDWNDEINEEGTPFTLLPEGDYDFKITKFERARYEGSEKMPPCNMAKITFEIFSKNESTTITDNFYLNSKGEWKISALYLAIGLKKHGEPIRMQWNSVIGKTGKLKLTVEKYSRRDGGVGEVNRIKKFYDFQGENTAPKWQAGAF